jgi:3-phosphoshikimate 1-carboxyvinyltransferase
MSDYFISPGRLSGKVEPPAAKSDAHRALIAAALSGNRQPVHGLPEPLSDDLAATAACLRALAQGHDTLDCGESGTTLRLLVPIVAAFDPAVRADPITFIGHGRLPRRPLDEYRDILSGGNLRLDFPADASLPLRLSGRLQPGTFLVPGHISSQYISGLLFALPLLDAPSQIRLTTPLQSAPYVAMTRRTLAEFSIVTNERPDGFDVPAPQTYQAKAYAIERDYSQAAFWLVAAYAGNPLTVTGLPDQTVQGDQAIIGLLDDFRRRQPSYTIDAAQIPDLVPILAVAATLTSALTRIVRAGRLRLKESDRLAAVQDVLSALGADISGDADSLTIRGGACSRFGRLRGGTVDSWGDHRIAMAVAIAALNTEQGVQLRHAEAVNKSYPDFFREFVRLGGVVHGLDLG